MTREEAINKWIIPTIKNTWNAKKCKEILEALEQEPFINKPCVSSGVCEHDKNKVLDKLRAEIDKIYEREGNSVDCLNALDELKWFIDKYKAKSEPQESEG